VTDRSLLESPRLRALADDLANDDSSAVAAFWAEVAEQGAPLIEPLEGEQGRRLVTFVWRRAEPAENVVVVQVLGPADFEAMRLTRLGESDLWYRTYQVSADVRTTYQFAVNDSLVSFTEETDWPARLAGWLPDPLNPRQFVESHATAEGRWERAQSILELPTAAPTPWAEPPAVPTPGSVEHRRFASRLLENERDIWVYTPSGDVEARTPRGLLVLFDGGAALTTLEVPRLLDALTAAGEVPPLVAVMVGALDRNAELPCNESFARFLADELVPAMRAEHGLSADPAATIAAGQSYGGLAAAWCGLRRPEVFGAVLSQSGSFWWKPDPFEIERPAVAGEAFEYEWLVREYVAASPAPVRFYMDVGTLEGRVLGNAPAHLHSNRHMRDVLRAKGYRLDYREYAGGHDYLWWRSTLADGLISLIGRR
jgi:enterochelin esterase-like enzyme